MERVAARARSSIACAPARCPSSPIHSATDSCYGWDDYGALVGARFDGHPWTQTFTADVLDPSHPACAHLGASGAGTTRCTSSATCAPTRRCCCACATASSTSTRPVRTPPSFGYPLAWCFTEGAGRVFSTSLGHFPSAWESPVYLRHLDGGLAWALGAD